MGYMEQQMQQHMEAGEQEYNALMDEFNPPVDWESPKWEVYDKVHGWRNYVSEGLKAEWSNFSGRQRIMLASCFDEAAGKEHWD
jgi:hypothetical protein